MKQKAVPPDSNRLKRLALAVAGGLGILLCVFIAWPFLGAMTWALTLPILFLPLHVRVEKLVKHPNIAALLSTAIVIVVEPSKAMVNVQARRTWMAGLVIGETFSVGATGLFPTATVTVRRIATAGPNRGPSAQPLAEPNTIRV